MIYLEIGNIFAEMQKYDEAIKNYKMGINHLKSDTGWELQVRRPLSDDALPQVNAEKSAQFICRSFPNATVITDDGDKKE
jgi:hypothetical protein